MTTLPAIAWQFVAGILERAGGMRVVCTDNPLELPAHVGPGEELFIVPRWKVWGPKIPYELWPLTVGAAEIHVATSIWPRRLKSWGTWEAEKYFNERVVPAMAGRDNRPSWWWQEPQRFHA